MTDLADELKHWLDLRSSHEDMDNALAADACDREVLRLVGEHQAAILDALRASRPEPAADAVEALAEAIARAISCHGDPPAICDCFGACDCMMEARKILAALPRPGADEGAPISFAELGKRGMEPRLEEALSTLIGDRIRAPEHLKLTPAETAALGYGAPCECGERGLRPGETSCTDCEDDDAALAAAQEGDHG